MDSLPIIYFKNSIACLDDNPIVFATLKDTLAETFLVNTFDNPQNFIDYIKNQQTYLVNNSFLRGLNESEYFNNPLSSIVEFNFSKILEIADNPVKHQEISVVIIDYIMPEKTGIEVCKELLTYKAKKLLLTGSKEYKIGLDALNKNIINGFLEKQTDIDEILDRVTNLSYSYFEHATASLREHLEVDYKLPLSDKAFIKYFIEFMGTHKIKEYYIIDKNGSLLLINENNNKSILIVHTERSINEFIKNFDDIDEIKNTIEEVRDKKLIPWFGIGKDNFVDLDELSKSLFKPNIIHGDEHYYLHHWTEN